MWRSHEQKSLLLSRESLGGWIYLADAREAGAEVRPLSTVTPVLTNQAGTRVTGVEYYDEKIALSLRGAEQLAANFSTVAG